MTTAPRIRVVAPGWLLMCLALIAGLLFVATPAQALDGAYVKHNTYSHRKTLIVECSNGKIVALARGKSAGCGVKAVQIPAHCIIPDISYLQSKAVWVPLKKSWNLYAQFWCERGYRT